MAGLPADVARIFLDTAPVIYHVEGHPTWAPRVLPVFAAIDRGTIIGVTSTITLAECLIQPLRTGANDLAQRFRDLLTKGRNTKCVGVDDCVELAAHIRAKYNVLLADAFQIAAAIQSGSDSFLTNDLALQRITEVRVLLVSAL